MVKNCICHSCGREVELDEGEKPCDVLCGWLMLSYLTGARLIDRYSFCSLDCLKIWVGEQSTDIPNVFLDSLDEKRDE